MEQRFETARERSNGFFIGAICALAAAFAFCAALFVPQHNAYAVTEGWEQEGTCEWRIDDEGTLTVRPVDDGETGEFQRFPGITVRSRESIIRVSIPKPIAPFDGYESDSSLFEGCSNLIEVDGLANLKGATSCTRMFYGCSSLESIDFSGFDASDVQWMDSMFYGCRSLKSVDLSGLNTSNVQTMDSMFFNSGLTTIDLSDLNLSNVTSMESMFTSCRNLENVIFGDADTSNVTSMSRMFSSCSIGNIDLQNLETNSVEDMSFMFSYYYGMDTLDLSAFDFSKATTLERFAMGSKSIKKVIWPSGEINAPMMACGFMNCSSLEAFDCSNTIFTNLTTAASFFEGCTSLASIDLSVFDTSDTTSFSQMFYGCSSLSSIDLSEVSTENAVSMSGMFQSCTSLSSIVVPDSFIPDDCKIDSLFGNCPSLTSIPTNFSFGANPTKSRVFGFPWGTTTIFDTYYEGSDPTILNYNWEGDNRRLITPAGDISGTVTVSSDPCAGVALKAAVSLDNSCADAQLLYQWFDAADNSAVTEATESAEFAILEGSEGKSFYCVVTDGSGAYESSLKSNAITASHAFGEWATTVEPTCTKDGVETRTCENCDATETRPVAAKGHTAGEAWESDATDHWHACANCDEHLDAAEHEFGEWAEKDTATCTEGGTEARTCSTCGYEETRKTDPAGHSFGEWGVTTPATCTTEGVESRTCEKCGETETRAIDATGHAFGEWATTVEPTCTKDGGETRTCENCDATETRPVAAKGHTAGEAWESDATDHWHACTECGVELDSEAHKFSEWTTTVEPTEDVAGERDRTCEVCNYVETAEIPATGHTADETWHSDEGSHWHVCTGCGEEIEKSAHEYGEWTTTLEPTCTEEGTKTRACTVCGYEQTETIPENGHSFGEWEVTTEPTCVDEGEETRTCENCDATETRPVPATGQHVYAGWASDENGHRHMCETCGLVADDAAHDFDDWSVKTAATCTEDGSQTRACATCGYEETAVIPAAGHSFGDWEIISDATETQDGSTKHVCKVCGFEETVAIPATGSQQGGQDNDQQGGQTDNAQGGSSNASGDSANGSNALAQTGDATPVVPIALGTLATLAVAGIAMRKLRA